MESFRTELENPVVSKDILNLEKQIRLFKEGVIHPDKFRSLRLARGIYGQRQPGVQMIRIKLPFGRLTVKQLLRIADVSDEYATGNLHLTTRQDIQIHFVSLDRTPELWGKLSLDDITIREACGNTVRNITGTYKAGIDPKEPFDISPYAHEMFQYFLRNPVCQEMGRKFKISFSSSEEDESLSYIHDIGFIPKVKQVDGQEVRGFKVVVGGGLGAQPYLAQLAYEFLEEDQIIPFAEGVIRVFDRYGERNRRHKARLKFLIEEIGFDTFLELVDKERLALKSKTYKINRDILSQPVPPIEREIPAVAIQDKAKYETWLKTNVFEQKQKGFYAVNIKILLGDMETEIARKLTPIVQAYAADDIRVTMNQGLMLKFIRKEALPVVFTELDKIGLADPGFDSTADVTACPGTDTCNLAISSSTGIAKELERVIEAEYPDLVYNSDIKIKISGCMNACGQHSIANIGFHGSSIKKGPNVLPALQVMIGGGTKGDGAGLVADKVIKVPSKRGPDVVRYILNDFEDNAVEGEYFNNYYARKGKDYYYQLLKPLASTEKLVESDFVDWGHNEKFETAIGVGECAGVMIDLVATLFYETEEKLSWAAEALESKIYADSIYHSYSAIISTAKAFLLTQDIACNTHHGIINDFDKQVIQNGIISLATDFKTFVGQINSNEPSEAFAKKYLQDAIDFYQQITVKRQQLQEQETNAA
ncbi:HEPN domain-containing protein [Rhodocytophaga aerolata]|uniref:HEPN domain-containing protein n=1 Tax=Rhodocytophaga aerolata TaxID=455078 RepID=A0ABT8R894_9BACT|nr:HEPN domain-containing protein [Rhodocytophaga aerolata]MDO1448312.1 HEPN domain-containing protein [Rhodocytophaga aerolata]